MTIFTTNKRNVLQCATVTDVTFRIHFLHSFYTSKHTPCLAVRSEELCDHGTGARVGHLEVMHLPSFFFPFSSLHCWPRLLPGRVLMAPTSNTYIRQEALLGAVNKMQHYLHCSSYDLFPWNISRHYILMNMHAIVWTYKNDTNKIWLKMYSK